MTWVAVAVAGGSIVGGLISSSGAQSAADTQAGAAKLAAEIGEQEFNTITLQEAPYTQGGYGALNALEYGLGITPNTGALPSTYSSLLGPNGAGPLGGSGMPMGSGMPTTSGGAYSAPVPTGEGRLGGGWISAADRIRGTIPGTPGASGAAAGTTPGPSYAGPAPGAQGTGLGYGSLLQPFTADNWKQLSPSYGFQLQHGEQGTLNGSAAGSGALSGAAQKDLMSFNQNLANTSFNNAFNMYQTQQGNIYQRLAGLTQLGQASAANTGQQGTALAGQIGQSVTNAGTAAAAGQIGSANAWSGAVNNMSYLPWLYNGGGGGGGDAGGGGGLSDVPGLTGGSIFGL